MTTATDTKQTQKQTAIAAARKQIESVIGKHPDGYKLTFDDCIALSNAGTLAERYEIGKLDSMDDRARAQAYAAIGSHVLNSKIERIAESMTRGTIITDECFSVEAAMIALRYTGDNAKTAAAHAIRTGLNAMVDAGAVLTARKRTVNVLAGGRKITRLHVEASARDKHPDLDLDGARKHDAKHGANTK